jgi:6-phosphogluconolactonase (cycloisomerase 2 family)
MKLSLFGRLSMALFASLTLGLGMTACGGGTIGYMWVLGQQYNNIAGFKIDDYTGNLTQIINSPFNANGSVPVSIAIKPGGRYVYVLNQGTGGSANGRGTSSGVSVFSVGGDGTLTYQTTYLSQGYVSQWMQLDQTGTYLYVLDKYAPSYVSTTGLWNGPNTSGNGAITVFSIDATTGRLTLQTNSSTQVNNVNTPFWVTGPTPFMMKVTNGCLFTLDSNQTVYPYSISGNQLATVTTGSSGIQLKTVNATSITGTSAFVIVTDNLTPAGTSPSIPGQIYQYTVGTSCNLAAASGGGGILLTSTTATPNPVYSLIDSTGKYLYVLNSSNTSTLTTSSYSSISAFTINTTNSQLQPISGSPYTVGSGPVCISEDPTNQYMYISNYNDGTVTGKVLDPTTGILSDLSRGSTFTAVGHAGCLAISGSVN